MQLLGYIHSLFQIHLFIRWWISVIGWLMLASTLFNISLVLLRDIHFLFLVCFSLPLSPPCLFCVKQYTPEWHFLQMLQFLYPISPTLASLLVEILRCTLLLLIVPVELYYSSTHSRFSCPQLYPWFQARVHSIVRLFCCMA